MSNIKDQSQERGKNAALRLSVFVLFINEKYLLAWVEWLHMQE